MMFSIIPTECIMHDPSTPYRATLYPRTVWQGVPVTMRGDIIQNVLSSDPRDYLRIGPCSSVSRYDR